MIKKIRTAILIFFTIVFAFIDVTKFTKWSKENIEFQALVKVGKCILLPISACFSVTLKQIARKIFVKGNNEPFLADAWYDNNEIFKQAFKNGYLSLIKPNKNRNKGYWKMKTIKLWNGIENRVFYRNR